MMKVFGSVWDSVYKKNLYLNLCTALASQQDCSKLGAHLIRFRVWLYIIL